MGFDVTLVYRPGAELPLHHHVSVFEALFLVANLVHKMTGNVGWFALVVVILESAGPEELPFGAEQPIMEDGRIRLHSFFGVQNGSQNFVVDFNHCQRSFRCVNAVRRHPGDCMAFV